MEENNTIKPIVLNEELCDAFYEAISKVKQIKCLADTSVLKDMAALFNSHFTSYAPKSFFKYRECNDQNITSLNNEEIWFNFPDNFNDDFDSFPMLATEIFDGKNLEIKDLMEAQSIFVQLMKNETKDNSVFCFSETVTSPLMWGHYTKKSTGFAIEYFPEDVYKLVNKMQIGFFAPVIYADTRVRSIEFSEMIFKFLTNTDEFESKTPEQGQYILKVVFTLLFSFYHKSLDWGYEREWRIVDCRIIKPKTLKPKAIYMGTKITKENLNTLLEIATEKDIMIYKMTQNYFNPGYELIYIPIEREASS